MAAADVSVTMAWATLYADLIYGSFEFQRMSLILRAITAGAVTAGAAANSGWTVSGYRGHV